MFTHTFTYMSSAILRSSFAASVRTTFSKSQRTTINTKRSVMTKAVSRRRRRRRRRFLFFSLCEPNDKMIGCAFFLSLLSIFCFRVNARENELTSQKLSCYTHTRTLTRDIFTFITQVTITEGVGTLLLMLLKNSVLSFFCSSSLFSRESLS